MELLFDDTDHIIYLTSNADNGSFNDPFVKKVKDRRITLPSVIYYDEYNNSWSSTATTTSKTGYSKNSNKNSTELNYNINAREGTDEYIFNGVIDSVTGEAITGICYNPITNETYEGNFVSGLRHDLHGYGTNLVMFGGVGAKYFGKWCKNEPVDGLVITKRYTYIGKLLHGQFSGRAWLAKSNMYIYDGEFKNGLFHGIGKSYESDDVTEFIGEFYFGVRQGIGMLRKKDYVYSGMWNCGVREGEGSEIVTDTNRNEEEYVGQFLRDKRHGFGMMTRHGVVCEGQWRRGQPVQEAWMVSYPDGRKYLGGLRHWMPHGKGIMIYSSSKGNELVIGAFDMGKYMKDEGGVTVDINGVHCNMNPQEAGILLGQTKKSKKTVGVGLDLITCADDLSGSSEEDVLLPKREEQANKKKTSSTNKIFQKTSDYYENGDVYHGQVDSYGRREGYGLYIQHTTGGTYEGVFSKNERHGNGMLFIPNRLKFCGEFYRDFIHGYGTLVFEDSSSYNGHFLRNCYHGKGTLCESDESIYVGHFRHGLRHGDGVEKYSDGKVFLGEYRGGKRHGIGTLLEKENGKLLYSGKWQDDLMDGYGVQATTCITDDSNDDNINEQFEGHFICGQRSGEGTLTLSNGYILQGTWQRDKPITPEKWNITYPNGNHYTGDAISPSDSSIIPIPHGTGKLKYSHGDIYEGDFYHGNRHGKGLCIYVNWDTWRGAWEEDAIAIHGGGELRLNNGTTRKFYKKNKGEEDVGTPCHNRPSLDLGNKNTCEKKKGHDDSVELNESLEEIMLNGKK